MNKCYSEMAKLSAFSERYEYLKLDGKVGEDTFGFDRIFNQRFYSSSEWRRVRDFVIVRDGGCDLGSSERRIYGRVIIHHINPITLADITAGSPRLLDPENLVCCSHITHCAIHYGDEGLLLCDEVEERKPNDTCPWKKN